MTTPHPLTRNRPILVLAGAAVFLAAIQLQPKWGFDRSKSNAGSPIQTAAATVQLPFSFDQVVNYFSDSLQQFPTQRSLNYARFDADRMQEGLFTVEVERRGAQISVRVEVIDDFGMNIVREFFEAPFFGPNESQQLYTLLSAGEGSRSAKMSRFDVLFDYQTRPQETVITLLFTGQAKVPHLPRF